jgi:NodT family efflux transporter outer membrane factor (OMF) lipoprotein
MMRGLWAVAWLLSACVTHSYEQPAGPSAALYRTDAPLQADRSIAALPWQSLFADPLLNTLIAEGLKHNLDLKTAIAQIDIAHANLEQSRAAFYPALQADAQYGFTHQPGGITNGPRATVSASASWEIDIWGKLRSAKRSALAQLYQSWALKHAVQTQLIAEIAAAYYSLLAYDRQLTLTEQAVAVRIEDVEAVRALKEAAVVTGADLVQSEANRYAAEVTIPDIKRNIREVENALSVLLGREPRAIVRGSIDQQFSLPALELGVPAQLLANRPDVRAAEHAFRSAFELTNVARTYFYPAFTITGAAGTTSTELQGLFNPGTFLANILGGLTQPILNRGLNVQRLRIARAQQKQALYDFQATLLRAGQETSDALFSFQMASAKAEARTRQLESLTRAVEFTKALLRYSSTTNYVDVLTAEQSLLTAQIASVNDRLQQLQAVVTLYRALGGGWREPERTRAAGR